MTDTAIYPVKTAVAEHALINKSSYQALYQQSIENPETFWAEQATQFLSWYQPWQSVMDFDYPSAYIRWFEGGKLNVSYNCLDRHLAQRGEQIAIIWEGDDPEQSRTLTYRELHREVCKFANVLKNQGVNKGDAVCIYMPMIPEAAVAMLACTRIGAVHSIVFGGFSAEALKDRILDADCRFLVCADEGFRGGKIIPIKAMVDKAASHCPNLERIIVVKHCDHAIDWQPSRDVWYHEAMAEASEISEPEIMDAEDPLFILYTSGSTGKPKGVLHSTAGYLLYAAITHQYVFDYHDGDIYWCSADVGWITGHSYVIYGPLCNGATTLMFEGVPTYPEADRFWQVIDKHQVNIFYTAPTALRALMARGDDYVTRTQRSSLRILGSVGEPINSEAWEWYYQVVGSSRCPIVDTWWQTETGGILISNMAGITPAKPSYATLPLPGVQPVLVDENGKEIEGNNVSGNLCIKAPWPSILRTTYGDHERCRLNYFSAYPDLYFTGDGCYRDENGNYRITGRVDDVLNVSGHRIGTAEVENAINMHAGVIESAVVGYPHDIKGQGIYAYVIYGHMHGDENLTRMDILQTVTRMIGPIAKPDKIQFVSGLPKTRSGKIMRRILRKIAEGELENLGDTTTLLDPAVVDEIKRGKI